MRQFYAIHLIIFGLLSTVAEGQSVLHSGKFHKLSVEKRGVYKVSYDLLKKAGFDPQEIDPTTIRIFGNRGGMLPQANSADRAPDLIEISLYVQGEADGTFDKDDFILFYADGPDEIDYNLTAATFRYINNLYSDQNFYFLTAGKEKGKRISHVDNLEGTFPSITTFDDFIYHELDQVNILEKNSNSGSGREWYGEKFGLENELTLSFRVDGVVSGCDVTLISDVIGQSYSPCSFKVSVNNVNVLEQPIAPIVQTTYASKGYDRRDTISFNENLIHAAERSQQDITYNFVKATGYSQGYLDNVLLSFKRHLRLYEKQTIFSSTESLSQATSTFIVENKNSSVTIWDISDLYNPKEIQAVTTGSGVKFSTETQFLKTFVAFSADVPLVQLAGSVEPQDLHSLSTPNLLIITHPSFAGEANRLAQHRATFSNWTTHVVTTDQIFNEFSSGRQDVTAIRDFVKHLYDKNKDALHALLLFGKGSYDYKNRSTNNQNFVPAYESRNSVHPLLTYSSDDFYCFLEDNEGEWKENPAEDHTLDIGVGRLPVTTLQQARDVVDKIIRYDTDKHTFGYWRKEIAFVADDGSTSDNFTDLHQEQANDLANLVQDLQPGFDTKKMFMGTYKKQISAGGETVPQLNTDIKNRFQKGAVIVNFTGHGNERKWTDEGIFSDVDVDVMKNDLLPFLVTATCEFGRHDNPYIISTAEMLVTHPKGGAIGLVTTTRPVNASSNFELNTAFYEAQLNKSSGRYPCLGEVFRNTKNNSFSGVGNRNFSLLADPSMTLALPVNDVSITAIKTESGSDTLKALSTVIVEGSINKPGGELLDGFDGEVQITLFDKETNFATSGRNPAPFEFRQWYNVLFRGRTNVQAGVFQFQFIVPKNIAYTIGEGRLSAYASDVNRHIDASGVSDDFKIGGTEKNFIADITPPTINVFIGDTTFVNGGITTPETSLVIKLSDASGINISDYGIGNSLVAVLDDDVETFNLNEYYITEKGDFTKGSVNFPLHDLEPGKHAITVKAWDVHNNASSSTIDFIVTDGQHIVIEDFGNYPNPFSDETTLFFTHNRSGDDLETEVFIYSPAGYLVASEKKSVFSSNYQVNILQFSNNGRSEKKLPPGLYLARVFVRSLTNGSKNERATKLIILN